MTDNVARGVPLRRLIEDEIPGLFEIQLHEAAQQLAAFTDAKTARDPDAFRQKCRKIMADHAIVNRVIELHGEVIGSVATFPVRTGGAGAWPLRPSRRCSTR